MMKVEELERLMRHAAPTYEVTVGSEYDLGEDNVATVHESFGVVFKRVMVDVQNKRVVFILREAKKSV